MATSILVWNIQRFTNEKIGALQKATRGIRKRKPKKKRKVPPTAKMVSQRLDYILNNVIQKDPDIFVIIEVVSGMGPRGSLINSKGRLGCIRLLEELRKLDANWSLIPPLRMINQVEISSTGGLQQLEHEKAYTEGAAVFYKSNKLDFQGPYIWPKTADPKNQNPDLTSEPSGDAGPYPPEWDGCLPANNYFAGQAVFTYGHNQTMEFPNNRSRSPFLVQFKELAAPNRIINVIAVHLPPELQSAKLALSKTTGYFTNYDLKDNEMMLMVGDFNIPAGDGTFREINGVGKEGNSKFKKVFNSTTSPNSSLYYATRVATPYRYMKDGQLVDNVLYRLGPNMAAPAVTAEILDRVLGKPPTIPSLMSTSLEKIKLEPTIDKENKAFRMFDNFGQLGHSPGTSDHIALYASV